VRAGLREPTRIRAAGAIALCVLLLLAGPAGAGAQDNGSVYSLLPENSRDHGLWIAAAEPGTDAPLSLGLSPRRPTWTPLTAADDFSSEGTESARGTQPCPTHRLLSADSSECLQHMAFAEQATEADAATVQEDVDAIPRWAFLEDHRLLFSILVPVTSILAVTANSLLGYENHDFRIHHEGFFGKHTTNGGADKASHMADYYIITNLFQDVYRMLGYSKHTALAWAAGLAFTTGLANELSDGFTRHGFSWEDLAMDASGVVAASLVSLTETKDLLSVRTSHLPGETYTHDVYSGDLKLSGVAERLDWNVGPLRWLLLSVTYNAKGYRVTPPEEQQRLLGFEVGLNLQQILFDLNVKRDTWWGYGLHLFADNIRFPYTAIGVRVDLNRGKWHGPNAGNYD
jgi:hypothetical protein